MTLKQRLQDAAEYAPDAAPPPALAARALARLSARRRTQKRRNDALLAATTAAVCLLALWAARPVLPPPAPQRVAAVPPGETHPHPPPVMGEGRKGRDKRETVAFPAPLPRREGPGVGSPSRAARRLSRRVRFAPRLRPVRHFRPVRRRPLLTVARPAPSPTVEPIVKAAPKTMVVPIVVAQISDDGASLVLTPAAVVITPAASQSRTE